MMLVPDIHFWNQIDAILIINLKHRTDRWDRLYRTLTEIGVEDKIIRIEAIDGKTLPGYLQKPWFRKMTSQKVASMKAGSAGCTLSHRKAIAYAKAKGFKRISLNEKQFERSIDLSLGEQIYQKLKRTNRLIRAWLFGYKKT